MTWKSSLLSIPRIQTFGISGGLTFPVFTFTVTFTFKFHTICLFHLVILPYLCVLIFFYFTCSTCKTILWILLLNYCFTVHLYQNWSHLQYLYSFTEFNPKFHIELQSQDCFSNFQQFYVCILLGITHVFVLFKAFLFKVIEVFLCVFSNSLLKFMIFSFKSLFWGSNAYFQFENIHTGCKGIWALGEILSRFFILFVFCADISTCVFLLILCLIYTGQLGKEEKMWGFSGGIGFVV